MKLSGLDRSELIDAYKKEVRSILELAIPVWNSGLTLDKVRQFERVQKSSHLLFWALNMKIMKML